MKKISKFLAVASSFAALFFASCSDIGNGTVSSEITDAVSTYRDYTVSFLGANGETLDLAAMGATRSARTIYDENVGDLDTYSFYLWGTNEVTNANITPSEVTFTADAADTTGSSGKVSLDLGASKYKLVLAAVKGSTTETTADGIKGVATYVGYANVDTRTTSTIRFVISSDGLTGESTATLTVMYDGLLTATPAGSWSAEDVDDVTNGTHGAYSITAGIYNRASGAVVGAENPLQASDFFGTAGAAYSATVQAGTYNFVVTFENAQTGKKYEYSDTIIILANNNFSATVKVPDVIESAPLAPSDFKVGYIAPSSVNDGEYNAVLGWVDKSSNERYFLVDVWDISTSSTNAETAIATIASDADWTAAINGLATTNQKKYGEDFYGSSDKGWVSGSLLKNNTNLVLKLSLGHRYIMRIAAINDAVDATSANYAYATYDLKTAYTSTDTAYDTGTSYTPVPFYLADEDLTAADKTGYAKNTNLSSCANLYRLTYHLYGGTLALDSTITGVTSDVVAYLSQDAANGVVIHAPFKDYTATTATYPSLIKNGNRWTSWRVEQVDGALYDYDDESANPLTDATENVTYYKPDNYKGCKNLDLFASYAVASADVSRFNDAEYAFVDGEVYFTEVTGKVTKVNDGYYTIDSGAGNVTLNYYYDKATDASKKKSANVAYTSLSMKITRSGSNSVVAQEDFTVSTTTRSCSFDTTPLTEGKYNVVVTGTYNGHVYTYAIVMEVKG